MDVDHVDVDDADDDRWIALAGPTPAAPADFPDRVLAQWRRRRRRAFVVVCAAAVAIVVVAAAVAVVVVEVRRRQQPKTLIVEVDGPPVFVVLDGQYWGVVRSSPPGETTAVIGGVAPGEHTLSLERISPLSSDVRPALQGWEDAHFIVDDDEETTRTAINLWLPAERLHVTTDPPGATVRFDSVKSVAAPSPAGFAFENANIASGTLSATMAGYAETVGRPIALAPGEEQREHFVLDSAHARDVDVIAPGAVVRANGVYGLGVAPLTIGRRLDHTSDADTSIVVHSVVLRWPCGLTEEHAVPPDEGPGRERIDAADPCGR